MDSKNSIFVGLKNIKYILIWNVDVYINNTSQVTDNLISVCIECIKMHFNNNKILVKINWMLKSSHLLSNYGNHIFIDIV